RCGLERDSAQHHRRAGPQAAQGLEPKNVPDVKPAVGFTLPWAGVTPAPSDKTKMRDFVPLELFSAEVAGFEDVEDVGEASVDDVAIVGEAAMLHDAARGLVVRQGEGDDSIEMHRFETELQRRE